MTDRNAPDAARPQTPPEAVRYEEWLEGCLGRLGEDDYVILFEAEELLLSRLMPLDEEAGPCAGLPSDVLNLADADDTPARRAEVLVHDLHAAAWRLPLSWPIHDGAARPIIYPRSDGSLYARAVGVYGPEGDRRAAFEHHLELRSLACSTPEDLRRLHEALTATVGEPLGPPPGDPAHPE